MAVRKRRKPRKQRVRQRGKGAISTALKVAQAAVKKFIPSTKHVFKRFRSGDVLKNGFVGPTGIIRKKFWTHPRKGTVMRLVKNAKTGKYENVYESR